MLEPSCGSAARRRVSRRGARRETASRPPSTSHPSHLDAWRLPAAPALPIAPLGSRRTVARSGSCLAQAPAALGPVPPATKPELGVAEHESPTSHSHQEQPKRRLCAPRGVGKSGTRWHDPDGGEHEERPEQPDLPITFTRRRCGRRNGGCGAVGVHGKHARASPSPAGMGNRSLVTYAARRQRGVKIGRRGIKKASRPPAAGRASHT
jgi:hypothetical protein